MRRTGFESRQLSPFLHVYVSYAKEGENAMVDDVYTNTAPTRAPTYNKSTSATCENHTTIGSQLR